MGAGPDGILCARDQGDSQSQAEPGGHYHFQCRKELPDAFLRRCIFHYIQFPDAQQMEEIIRVHLGEVDQILLSQVIEAFYWLRSLRGLEKRPSTSELIDWVRALILGGIAPERITSELPFLGVVLKKERDVRLVREKLR